jgi:cyclase
MLKKRLIGVVTIRDGRAVQSFNYTRWLPLGRAECVVENLDRWGADEILVLSTDRASKGLGPDLELIARIGSLGLRTPIAYGGGIRTAEDGVEVVHAGADRVVVDSILHIDPQAANRLADRLGAQAVIAALPLSLYEGNLRWLDHVRRCEHPIPSSLVNLIAGRDVSEVLLIDWRNEGSPGTFDERLIDVLPDFLGPIPLIAFGGIGSPAQCLALLERHDVAAVALGNTLNYQEHSIQAAKEEIPEGLLRRAVYEDAEEWIGSC